MRFLARPFHLAIALALTASSAWAQAPAPGSFPAQETVTLANAATATPGLKEADTGFMMICAAMVLLMTPGLGLFYGGMVRRKNVLSTFQQPPTATRTASIRAVSRSLGCHKQHKYQS